MKSGFIAIVGKPNVGKSTLLNYLVGEKVSIVSWRPQTTRNKIRGILNGDGYQIVFIDTPGTIMSDSGLARYMKKSISSATIDVDIVLYVLDVTKKVSTEELKVISDNANRGTGKFFVVLNKCDDVKKENILIALSQLNDINGIDCIIPISAKTGDGVDILLDEIVKRLEDGEVFYPQDMYTDSNLRFMASEAIREKALMLLQDEIPHGIAVYVEKFDFNEKNSVTYIDAVIVTEKDSHKPIIIGKGGATLKRISTAARKEIEALIDGKVFLSLFVKVRKDWQDNRNMLNMFGYDSENDN